MKNLSTPSAHSCDEVVASPDLVSYDGIQGQCYLKKVQEKKNCRYSPTVTVLYATVEPSKEVTFCYFVCEILRMITYCKYRESYYFDSQGNMLQFQLQSMFHN